MRIRSNQASSPVQQMPPRPPMREPSFGSTRNHIAAAQRQRQIFQFFLLVFTILGILFIILPKEAQSDREKRTLQQRPAFSFERLFNGTYADEIELYYADQFPGREALISLNDGLERRMSGLFGRKDSIQIIQVDRGEGGAEGGVAIPGTAAGQTPAGQTPAAQAPATDSINDPKVDSSTDPVVDDATTAPGDTEVADTPATDDAPASPAADPNEPLPDVDVGEMQYNSGQIIIVGGHAMELYHYNRNLNVRYAERINRLADRLPATSRVSSVLIPSSVAFYGPEDFRVDSYSSIKALETVEQVLNPSIYFVNVYNALRPHADEYLYFRTDHHWTGRGAYYAYAEYARLLGEEVRPLDAYEVKIPDGTFLGSLYNYTNQNPLLLEQPDQGEFFYPEHTATHVRYSGAAMTDPQDTLFLAYDFPGDGHYALYAEGDYPLVVAESTLKNGRSVLVLKDSFANAFYPYLIDMYEKVYVIDPRHFSDPLVPFIEEQGIDDVVFVNYTFTVSIDQWLNGFDAIVPAEGS